MPGRDNTLTPGGQNNWGTGQIYIRRGLVSVTLFATNNCTIVTDSGNPLTYHVVEHMPSGQQYDISGPASLVSPADLRSLIVSGSITPYDYDPISPRGNEGYIPLVSGSGAAVSVYPPDIDGGGA